jgi:hypothetical protein
MKYLLSILLIACFMQGKGQTINHFPNATITMNFNNGDTILCVSVDTVILNLRSQAPVHFIKIGSEVYQIVEHPATIERVEPLNWPKPGWKSVMPGLWQLTPDTSVDKNFYPIAAPVNSKP